MKSKYFRNKVAVITGAASGIGRLFAINLAKMGTKLVITDINMDALEQVRKEIEANHQKVIALKCDVTKHSDARKVARTTIKEMGCVDFLFSNAGIAVGGSFSTLTIPLWKRIVDINLFGMIHMVMEFMPKFLEQGSGHIIVTGSIASHLGIGGLTPYNTTKFANAGFCESIYGEYHSKGINVSVVCPFPLKTNLMDSVGIGISPELLDGIHPEILSTKIEDAKKRYWEEFTKKQSVLKGYAGGIPVEKAVKIFLKKISQKKFYIFDRRYGRLLMFLKPFWPGIYKKFINTMGQRHIGLFNNTINYALEKAKKEE